MMYNIVGYLGLALNLFSMYTKGEYKLRIFSAVANFIYIFYGVLIGAFPIIIGSSIAVILHMYRLNSIKKLK